MGSLLFVLYINDITKFIQCQLGVFADDTKIYSIIRSICDVIKLQRDLDKMQKWSRIYLFNLNLVKCKLVHIGKTLSSNYPAKTTTTPRSVLNLNEVDVEKYLGIWTTSSIKFSTATKLLLAQQKLWECLRGHL